MHDLQETKRKIAAHRASRAAVVQATSEAALDPPCRYRGKSLGMVPCTCKSRELEAYACEIKGRCTVHKALLPREADVEICRLCRSRPDCKALVWSVGCTTVLSRRSTLLPGTLTSLARVGWENPHLFVDGGTASDWQGCNYPLTVHRKTHPYGNWWLALQELYVINPEADRYLIVQDDVKFVKGLRQYLDVVRWPGRGYLNLYCCPKNQPFAKNKQGFFRCWQVGLGALALVFDRDSIVEILASKFMIEKFRQGSDPSKPWYAKKGIDKGVSLAMRRAGLTEWCHNPSLVQHTGEDSSLGHKNDPSTNFSEDFDLMGLIRPLPGRELLK